ncbi:MAG: ABC transporter substrate-binding protein [Roseicyclus sp.]|nr:ABC transporter substrate-binding protein [Roseicyclus sp.]MBO6625023.1 ABC transporter substrate-binding protein [Roseicyclus sp.]MBO6923311.1 ABC transporter substrate-binding protein [Roseicyclus sp.]
MAKTKPLKTILTTCLAAAVALPAWAEGELSLLTWEGYADDSFIAAFEAETGCRVSATYVGSGEEIIAKMAAGGGVYDLITPASDITKLIIEAGFVESIDISRIDEWENIYPQFRELDNIQMDGEYYAMPYTWGAIAFMYRDDAFETPPTSLAALFDPRNEGRIALWDDKSAIYVAARYNGDTNIYTLSDEQIAAAVETLIEQRPLVRRYWSTAGELVDLYVGGEVDISNTWAGYQSALIAAEGIEVTEFIPEENAEGWMDSWMIADGSADNACTYPFLNMQLSEQGQCGVANVNGYSVANPVAARNCMTEEQFVALHQDDPAYLDALLMWQPLGDRMGAYVNAWNSVKAQ